MKNIISKSTFIIKIDGKPVSCYYNIAKDDDNVYIDVDTSNDLLKKSIEEVEIVGVELIINDIIYNKKVYLLDDFIEHLKPKPLKYLAKYAFLTISNNPFDSGDMDDLDMEFEEEKPKLSSFDKKNKESFELQP